MELARELIDSKLRGQATIAQSRLGAPDLADQLNRLAESASDAPRVELVRRAEAQGASLY